MLTITTPAESRDLVSTAKAKAYIKPSDTDLTTLYDLISVASRFIVDYCGREFAREVISEEVRGYGSHNLTLARSPIESVTSVSRYGELITDYKIDSEAGLLYRPSGWSWSAGVWGDLSYRPRPGSEDYIFTVEYTAGYWLPSFTSVQPAGVVTLPITIEQACVDIAKYWFDLFVAGRNEGLKSIQIGEYKEEYIAGITTETIPAPLLHKLKPYRRIV